MKKHETTKKAYENIFNEIEKYNEICEIDIDDLKQKSEVHLFHIELNEKYGLVIPRSKIWSLKWNSLSEYISIGIWGEKYHRTIGWSDDGRQPENEMLFYIRFSTGAYIFGEDYQKETFIKFFNELKAYNPKYCDTRNNSLYFTLENSKKIYDDFESIYNKYRKLAKTEREKARIKELKKELETLDNNLS